MELFVVHPPLIIPISCASYPNVMRRLRQGRFSSPALVLVGVRDVADQ